jgi:hypothetical protein
MKFISPPPLPAPTPQKKELEFGTHIQEWEAGKRAKTNHVIRVAIIFFNNFFIIEN